MQVIEEPRLAPPGAGLPLPELLVARVIFAVRRARGSAASFTRDFTTERARVAALVGPCSATSAAKRVLTPRLRGLEDSSRHWSVWMTLDHLRIVHGAISGVIASLARGVVPEGTASTAAVKPSPAVTAAVVATYEASCDSLLSTVANAGELRTGARYAHPWFGPLDAFGWHALAGMHLAIHRRQIETILAARGASH